MVVKIRNIGNSMIAFGIIGIISELLSIAFINANCFGGYHPSSFIYTLIYLIVGFVGVRIKKQRNVM